MDWKFTPQEAFAAFSRTPWDHQHKAVVDVCDTFARGIRSLVLALPTGSGKSLLATALIELVTGRGGKVIVYNSRKMLTKQFMDHFDGTGAHIGIRASSYGDMTDFSAPIQIAQLQTDIKRVIKDERWSLFNADLVIIDEAHMSLSEMPVKLIQKYMAAGACVLGLTGTPVGMSGVYKKCIVGATNSQLRACGAHVIAKYFGVHEVDVSRIKTEKTGEYKIGDIIKECWSQAIVGHIYNDWRRLNPDALPTLCASPGIGESMWVADLFHQKGHKVAHIDCKKVVVGTDVYNNDAKGEVREQVMEEAKKGAFDIVCNCEILREGYDWPDLRHLILARPYGSLANFIQTVGRAIRSSPSTGKHCCVIQDHGGNHRHGSPNADRDWEEYFSMSEKEIAEKRKKDQQEGKEPKPIICPQCGQARLGGPKCPSCGNQADPRVRMIVQKDGSLVERIFDDTPTPERPKKPPEIVKLNDIFFRLRNSTKRAPSDNQVLAVYRRKHGEYPPQEIIDTWYNDRQLYRQGKS
jgi:DNA repair protein RadD